MQTVCRALLLALARAGSSRLARMAMMAMTTNSSMRVNPARFVFIILFIDTWRLNRRRGMYRVSGD